jgi:hypothetical protein
MSFLIYFKASELWKQIISHKITKQFNWFYEIINLQWKYAISWASGFLIVSFYVPVIYKIDGAVLAGKFGITLAILTAIQGVGFSWLQAKIPKFNILVSLEKYKTLYSLFYKATKIGFIILIFFFSLIILFMLVLQQFPFISDRFLSLLQTSLLVIYLLETYITGSLALFLRTFKKEPFYFFSVSNAVFISLNTTLCLVFYDLTIALIIQVLISTVVFLPWAFRLLNTHFKNE